MGESTGNPWFWMVLLVYFAFCIYLGIDAYKHQKRSSSAEEEHFDFWITGRQQPAYMVGMSIASGWMLLGFMTWMVWACYDSGMAGLWIVNIPWFIGLGVTIWLVGRERRIKAISIPQMLHNRFGLPARIFLSPLHIFCYTVWAAAELYAASLVMAPALGISVKLMVLIYTIPIAIYMVLGGFRSVMKANIIQFFMGAIIMVVVAIASWFVAQGIAAGHGTSIWAILKSQQLINSMHYPLKSTANATTLFGYVSMAFPMVVMFALIPGWNIGEDFWLKAQSAISTKQARKGAFFNLFYNVVFMVICTTVIGLMAIIIFPPVVKQGVLMSASVLGDKGGYNVISVFINSYFPTWARFILVFFLSAHSMSTIATYSNICALNLSYDILQPLWYRPKKWSDKRIVKWSRIITLFIVVLTAAVALLYDTSIMSSPLNDAYFLSSGLLSAGGAVMVYSLFWRRANLTGVMAGGISGTLATIIFFILEYKVWDFSYTMPVFDWIFGKGAMASTGLGYCIVGIVFGLAGLLIGTYLTAPPTREQVNEVAAAPVDDNEKFFEGVRSTS